MTKFDASKWCDYVRGLADPDAEREMREHLAAGNPRAQKTVNMLARVRDVARADQELAVPDYAVRVAKAIGSLERRETEDVPGASRWSFLPLELAFDSLREPALAGTRDMQASFRQLSFKSQDYQVDLRLEPEGDPAGAVMVGQVLQHGDSPTPVVEAPVLVTSEGKIVERAVTSRFGEFHAEGLPQTALELYVLLDDDRSLRVPIEPG